MKQVIFQHRMKKVNCLCQLSLSWLYIHIPHIPFVYRNEFYRLIDILINNYFLIIRVN